MAETHVVNGIDSPPPHPKGSDFRHSGRFPAVICAAAAVAVCGAAMLVSISVRDWRVSALVRMSPSEPMASVAREADPDFAFVDPQAHYDGVYFYAIGTDPFARGEAHELIEGDRGAYRYGHAGYGWLAWAGSAGRTSAVPAALAIIGLAGTAIAGYAFSRLGVELGMTPWMGLVVALSPGIIYAATAATSETVMVAALACSLLMWVRGRLGWAAAAITAACFIKEPMVLVPVGLGAWTLIDALRGRGENMWKRFAFLAIGPVLYGGWVLYLRSVFGVWPSQQASGDFLSFPFSGWIDSLRQAASLANQSFDRMQIGNGSVALIMAAAALMLIGIFQALRLRHPVAPVFLFLALLTSMLNWFGLLYPKDLVRELVPALTLLPFLFARGSVPRPPRV